MKRLACLALALAFLPGAAPAPVEEGIPVAFQGAWAREPGQCAAGDAAVAGKLTIELWYLTQGETGKHVMAVRRVSPERIRVDSKDSVAEDESWTATTLLTLSENAGSLASQSTRKNRRRLPLVPPEIYRGCP